MAEKKETKKKEVKEKVSPVTESNEEVLEEIVENEIIEFDKNEVIDFKGEYIKAVGRRKTSVAQVRLYKKGKGAIVVNGLKINKYFTGKALGIITQPLKTLGQLKDFNFSVLVRGGGKKGQADAVRLGISRALLQDDEENKAALKVNGYLTRDPRQKERKKPGLKKARKRPQWSKR